MDTVLQGPDGQAARDMNGTTLTMEEMLRRRGINRMGNNVSFLDPNAAAANPTAQPVATSAAAATMRAQAQAAGGGANPAVQASTTPTSGTTSVTNADPAATAQALVDSGSTPESISTLEGLGIVAAGTAALAAAYAASKLRGSATPATGIDPNIPDAEFTEVPNQRALEAPQSVKQVRTGQATKAIEGPQKALPAPSGRRTSAEALQARAAKGGPTDVGTIAGQAPVRTMSEAPEAGLGRTLGLPQELIKTLKANPGLAKLLTRGM